MDTRKVNLTTFLFVLVVLKGKNVITHLISGPLDFYRRMRVRLQQQAVPSLPKDDHPWSIGGGGLPSTFFLSSLQLKKPDPTGLDPATLPDLSWHPAPAAQKGCTSQHHPLSLPYHPVPKLPQLDPPSYSSAFAALPSDLGPPTLASVVAAPLPSQLDPPSAYTSVSVLPSKLDMPSQQMHQQQAGRPLLLPILPLHIPKLPDPPSDKPEEEVNFGQPGIHQVTYLLEPGQTLEQLRDDNAMQIDHPTEHLTIHQPFVLLSQREDRDQQIKNELSFMQQRYPLLLEAPDEQPSSASELRVTNQFNLPNSVPRLLPSPMLKEPLMLEGEPEHDANRLINLPVLAARSQLFEEEDSSSATSSISSSSFARFMLDLDANISAAEETQAELSQQAEASELKLDRATAMSVNIATSIHAHLLFEQSICKDNVNSWSPPFHSIVMEHHHHNHPPLEECNTANNSKAENPLSYLPPKQTVRDVQEKKKIFKPKQAARDIKRKLGNIFKPKQAARDNKRKLGNINLDGNIGSIEHEHLQSIRSSLREYDSLMSRKAHSDPENIATKKFSRVLALDNDVVMF